MTNTEPSEKKPVGRISRPQVCASGLDPAPSGTAKSNGSGDIASPKTVGGRLRESDADFRDVFDNTLLGLYRTTPDGRILMANPALLRMLGYSSFDELAKRNLEESGFEAGYPRSFFKERLDAEGKIVGLESAWTRHDGTTLFVRENAKAVRDANGKTLYYAGTVEDITEHKRAEEKVRLSEEKYRLLAENATDMVWTANMDLGLTYVSPSVQRMRGFTVGKAMAQTLEDMVAPSSIETALKVIEEGLVEESAGAANPSKVWTVELQLTHKNGPPIWTESTVGFIRDESGRPTGIRASSRDITERKKAEEALKEQEQRLELFFSQSLDGFFFMMLDEPVTWNDTVDKKKVLDYVFEHQRITKVNDAMLEQYGASREQFLGQTPAVLFKHNPEHGKEVWRKFFDAGRLHVETDERRLDGTPIWIEGDYICLYDDEGRITGHFGIQRDITERKQIENELKTSEEKYRFLFEAVPVGIAIADFDGNILACNRALQEMVGHSFDELHSMNLRDIYTAAEEQTELIEAAKAQRRIRNWEHELTTNEGEPGSLLINADVVERGGQKVLVTTSRDITERKIAEDALKRAHQKLEGRVFQRTMELASTNQELTTEITERRTAQKALAEELETSQRRQAEVSALLQGSRVVLEHHTFEDAARKLFDYCKELTGATSGYVALLNDAGLENELLFLDPGEMTCSVDPSLPMPIRGLREVVYRTGEPACENDFSQSDWMRFMPPGHVRLENVLFAPLNIKGKTVGLLGLGNKPGGFKDVDLRMAGAFAELAAVALNNSRTLGELRQSQKELSEARDHLEELVEDRTAELLRTNRNLEEEIARRRKAGQELVDKQNQLKTLTSELALAEERERRRIAVGIHDNIGQKMALAKLELQSAMMSQGDPKTTESLQSVCSRIDEAIRETQSLTFELSNPALYELGFDAAIEQWVLEQIQKKQNIKCEVTTDAEPVDLGVNLKVVLFQAIRELAVNVVKYANAGTLQIGLSKSGGRIVVSVADDGVGFVPAGTGSVSAGEKGGFGLLNIKERLEYLGGSMKIRSAPNKGTTITLTAPLDRQ